MYADRVAEGTKRSVKERLNGGPDEGLDRRRQINGKRQRPDDDKWKHDLYQDSKDSQAPNPRIGARDLRLKLQKKASQQSQSGKSSEVHDLREKLSGLTQVQPRNSEPLRAKPVAEVVKHLKRSTISVEAPANTKNVSNQPSKKKSQQKTDLSVDGFLRSLGLEKYLITFQAEEVDMTALKHMSDEDLKALGIPMGPRKKILLALDPRT
ncbi:hypothetical protein QJS10_CPB22g00684 [Acorus calamus]|uniref:SAM domain-containing protein n=1 Tax=Acorus calamus TaxID=4465 RepID=A0AAV9C143_ACOCL|nr:hypothetical protein QJS10_CPB22g00684 [Acorus calamus]